MVKNFVDYVPGRGDLVWLQFDPQAGHEQGGRRPALVISPQAYNGKVGLALMRPVTSKAKGYPFEAPLPEDTKLSGVILADQIKSLDWQARQAEFAGKIQEEVVNEVLLKIQMLIS